MNVFESREFQDFAKKMESKLKACIIVDIIISILALACFLRLKEYCGMFPLIFSFVPVVLAFLQYLFLTQICNKNEALLSTSVVNGKYLIKRFKKQDVESDELYYADFVLCGLLTKFLVEYRKADKVTESEYQEYKTQKFIEQGFTGMFILGACGFSLQMLTTISDTFSDLITSIVIVYCIAVFIVYVRASIELVFNKRRKVVTGHEIKNWYGVKSIRDDAKYEVEYRDYVIGKYVIKYKEV